MYNLPDSQYFETLLDFLVDLNLKDATKLIRYHASLKIISNAMRIPELSDIFFRHI